MPTGRLGLRDGSTIDAGHHVPLKIFVKMAILSHLSDSFQGNYPSIIEQTT